MSILRDPNLNVGITRSFIGLNIVVHALWNFSERGIAWDIYTSLQDTVFGSCLPTTSAWDVKRVLERYFMLVSGREATWNLVGSAVSHQGAAHLAINMASVFLAGDMLTAYLPPLHYLSLILGSAVTSGLAFLYTPQSLHPMPVPSKSFLSSTTRVDFNPVPLGASGIASALTVVAAAFCPTRPVKSGVLPVSLPMWMAAVVCNVVDARSMHSSAQAGARYVR